MRGCAPWDPAKWCMRRAKFIALKLAPLKNIPSSVSFVGGCMDLSIRSLFAVLASALAGRARTRCDGDVLPSTD